MPCIDGPGLRTSLGALALSLATASCGTAAGLEAGAAATPSLTAATARVALPRPAAARDWGAFKRQAAERLVAASPGQVFRGEPPAELFAIPVLEVELARDGTVRRIVVRRRPTNPAAQDTVRIAIDSVHRAAPFGDMSALAKPWLWTEVFLFNERRQFKPRTLDE